MIWSQASRWCPLGICKLRSCVDILQPRRFAGHSHWQNVRHTKEAKDKIKSNNSQYYRRAVFNAIKAGGGIKDPKLNSYLADVVAEAKANSVPYSTLERAINADDTTDPYVVEIQAQGGLFILVETCAKPVNPERQRLRALTKKYGCTIPSAIGKIATEFFDHVGQLVVKGGPDTKVEDLDSATTLGIEIGAADVSELTEDKQIMYQFQCDPLDVMKLQQSLEQNHSIPVISATDLYIPKTRVLVTPAVYANLTEMYGRIRDLHEHVDRIFDNVTLDEKT